MHMVLVADYCGEKLAWFLGITSPKYQSAIDEYNRIKKQVCIIKIIHLLFHWRQQIVM